MDRKHEITDVRFYKNQRPTTHDLNHFFVQMRKHNHNWGIKSDPEYYMGLKVNHGTVLGTDHANDNFYDNLMYTGSDMSMMIGKSSFYSPVKTKKYVDNYSMSHLSPDNHHTHAHHISAHVTNIRTVHKETANTDDFIDKCVSSEKTNLPAIVPSGVGKINWEKEGIDGEGETRDGRDVRNILSSNVWTQGTRTIDEDEVTISEKLPPVYNYDTLKDPNNSLTLRDHIYAVMDPGLVDPGNPHGLNKYKLPGYDDVWYTYPLEHCINVSYSYMWKDSANWYKDADNTFKSWADLASKYGLFHTCLVKESFLSGIQRDHYPDNEELGYKGGYDKLFVGNFRYFPTAYHVNTANLLHKFSLNLYPDMGYRSYSDNRYTCMLQYKMEVLNAFGSVRMVDTNYTEEYITDKFFPLFSIYYDEIENSDNYYPSDIIPRYKKHAAYGIPGIDYTVSEKQRTMLNPQTILSNMTVVRKKVSYNLNSVRNEVILRNGFEKKSATDFYGSYAVDFNSFNASIKVIKAGDTDTIECLRCSAGVNFQPDPRLIWMYGESAVSYGQTTNKLFKYLDDIYVGTSWRKDNLEDCPHTFLPQYNGLIFVGVDKYIEDGKLISNNIIGKYLDWFYNPSKFEYNDIGHILQESENYSFTPIDAYYHLAAPRFQIDANYREGLEEIEIEFVIPDSEEFHNTTYQFSLLPDREKSKDNTVSTSFTEAHRLADRFIILIKGRVNLLGPKQYDYPDESDPNTVNQENCVVSSTTFGNNNYTEAVWARIITLPLPYWKEDGDKRVYDTVYADKNPSDRNPMTVVFNLKLNGTDWITGNDAGSTWMYPEEFKIIAFSNPAFAEPEKGVVSIYKYDTYNSVYDNSWETVRNRQGLFVSPYQFSTKYGDEKTSNLYMQFLWNNTDPKPIILNMSKTVGVLRQIPAIDWSTEATENTWNLWEHGSVDRIQEHSSEIYLSNAYNLMNIEASSAKAYIEVDGNTPVKKPPILGLPCEVAFAASSTGARVLYIVEKTDPPVETKIVDIPGNWTNYTWTPQSEYNDHDCYLHLVGDKFDKSSLLFKVTSISESEWATAKCGRSIFYIKSLNLIIKQHFMPQTLTEGESPQSIESVGRLSQHLFYKANQDYSDIPLTKLMSALRGQEFSKDVVNTNLTDLYFHCYNRFGVATLLYIPLFKFGGRIIRILVEGLARNLAEVKNLKLYAYGIENKQSISCGPLMSYSMFEGTGLGISQSQANSLFHESLEAQCNQFVSNRIPPLYVKQQVVDMELPIRMADVSTTHLENPVIENWLTFRSYFDIDLKRSSNKDYKLLAIFITTEPTPNIHTGTIGTGVERSFESVTPYYIGYSYSDKFEDESTE